MKYDYGDDVLFKVRDESGNIVMKPCTVVGITPVENEEQSRVLGYPLGTVLYTVEFGDGSDALLPEKHLAAAFTRPSPTIGFYLINQLLHVCRDRLLESSNTVRSPRTRGPTIFPA